MKKRKHAEGDDSVNADDEEVVVDDYDDEDDAGTVISVPMTVKSKASRLSRDSAGDMSLDLGNMLSPIERNAGN